jgi:hypothetical protein
MLNALTLREIYTSVIILWISRVIIFQNFGGKEGAMVPSESAPLEKIRSQCTSIVIIEKECIYGEFVQAEFHRTFNCILLTVSTTVAFRGLEVTISHFSPREEVKETCLLGDWSNGSSTSWAFQRISWFGSHYFVGL